MVEFLEPRFATTEELLARRDDLLTNLAREAAIARELRVPFNVERDACKEAADLREMMVRVSEARPLPGEERFTGAGFARLSLLLRAALDRCRFFEEVKHELEGIGNVIMSLRLQVNEIHEELQRRGAVPVELLPLDLLA